MEFTNEEIAIARSQKEEGKYKDIYEGEVRAGNEIMLFERIELCSNRFSIMLPKEYKDMPIAQAKIKYPMEDRPTVIKTNDDTTVNFAFSFYDIELLEEQVETAAKELKAGLKRITPTARFFEIQLLSTETGKKFSCFDFISTALDTELYQLFGFIPIQKKFLHVIFNCQAQLMRTWQPIAIAVLKSVCEIRDDTQAQ